MKDQATTESSAVLLAWRVHGIPLLVSPSWLASLALMAATCAMAIHALAPRLSPLGVGTTGTLLAFGLTGSLIVHELAHALVARRAGIGVDHIRLFLGGALCRRQHAINAPREQFVVAAAGPLASTALATGTLGVALGVGALGSSHLVTTVLWLLAFGNMLVAAANLLPLFPFDGGKLVHSLLWRKNQDRHAAADRLDRAGREFSKVVVALGLILIAFGGELLIGLAVSLFGGYLLRLPPPLKP